MSSLTTCIRKAGKALTAEDAAAIRDIANDLGDPAAAIDEYIGTLDEERAQILADIQKAGGRQLDEIFRTSGFEAAEVEADPDINELRAQLPLRYKIEDEFIEQLVDKRPENPIAQLSKLGAIIEEVAGSTKQTNVREMVEKSKDLTINAALALVPQSKLGEFIRTGMAGVRNYVRTMKRMDGFINERLEEQAETGAIWRDMIRKNGKDAKLLGEIMHQATLLQTDPAKSFELPAGFDKMKNDQKRIWIKRKLDHAVLLKFWNKLSPDAQALYEKVRDDYVNMRNEVREGLEARIEAAEADQMSKAKLIGELRQRFEAGRVEPYFPLTRFGRHWATAKNSEGEVVAFIKRENRAERNQWVKEIRALGYDAFASEEKSSDLQNIQRMDPNFVAKVTEMTNKMGPEGTAIADQVWQMYLRSLPEMSAQKAYIHRQGRLGFTGDALRGYGYHMFHGTHQLGKLNFGHQLQNALDNINQEARELTGRADRIKNSIKNDGEAKTQEALTNFPRFKTLFDRYTGTEQERKDKALAKFTKEAEVDAPWAQPLADEMNKRHDYNMNPMSAAWASKLTSLGFFWFLSTSPAAGVLNLTQTAIVGVPTLGARFNNMAGATGALFKASVQLMRTRGDLKNVLRGDERKAFEEFDRIGMLSKTRVRDITGYAERGEDFSSRWQSVIDITSWIFHKTEAWNREITALAAYRMSREAGRDHDGAIYEAEELVEMSHFDYTNTNRPRVMQKDAARVALLFRNYSVNMSYRLVRDFRDGVLRNSNVDPEVRTEAAKRLSGILGMTFLFAGVSGLPLAWAVHGVIDSLLGTDDEPYDSYAATRAYLTDTYGEEMATFIMKGGWDTATGASISNRASLNNLWIREVPDNLTGKDMISHLLVEAAGPMAGMLANAAEGVENIEQGYTERGIEKLMPKFASDMMKMARFATEGALNYDRDVIVSPEEFSNRDLFAQAMGFTPTVLATKYEQQRAIRDHDAALTRRRSYLMDRLFMSYKLGDKKETADTMVLIRAWNKANPREAISFSNIMQSAKVRADYDRRAIDGTTISRKRHQLHERYRFTDKESDDE